MSTRTESFVRQKMLPNVHVAGSARYATGSDWASEQAVPAAVELHGQLQRRAVGKGGPPAAAIIAVAGSPAETAMSGAELRLLCRTAELANAALSLSEGVAAIHELLAAELGWFSHGWRVIGGFQPWSETSQGPETSLKHWQLLNGAGSKKAWSENSRPVLLQVADQDRLLAVLAFRAERHEVSGEQKQLLAQVGQQLLVLARRDASRQGILAREFEILRQGQLAGMAELAQGLSHELSQPLTALAAYSGALQRKLAKGRNDHQDIAYLGDRLLQQVERAGAILQAAKSFILQRTCATGSVDVEATVRQLKRLVQPTLQAASVELLFEIANGLPPARGSEAHLVQIVLGLLANAMSALQPIAPSQRRIRIEVVRIEREVRISVIDSGQHACTQLAEEQLPFFAAYSDSSRISLAISRSLAEIQGGRLWREERAGETAFSVALPLLH